MSTDSHILGQYREKVLRWRSLLITFFLGQGVSQVLQLVSGFAIIHWLSKGQYATFALLLAIRGTSSVLMDLGFSGGLSALIGDRCHQPIVVGRYIAAARYYRNRLLTFGGIILLGVLLFASYRYEWGIGLGVLFWCVLIVSIFYDAIASFYTPIFYLQQRIRDLYLVHISTSCVRLSLLCLAYLTGVLSAPVAIIIGGIQSILSAMIYQRKTAADVKLPEDGDLIEPEKKEALQLTLPKVPGAIFYAFQGQVTIFIVSVVGQYSQIADLGALSRIGMLFMMPSALISVLIAPWFAKLAPNRLAVGYLVSGLLFSVFAVSLIVANALFPQVFLFILGSEYSELKTEVFLFSIFASLNVLSGLVFALNASRKWVYYWTGPTTILAYMLTLVFFVVSVDLTLISNIITMSIITATLTLCVNLVVSLVGFRRMRLTK
ncbi:MULTISPECIES: lipopolysaccharide biosynthesis protein [unclassified Lentimonas]|uniref:lipopolysaccharide biosynthesis protein n=1 Tax=unclassified Lentimonas TaxID=2630993 RepID=UPI00132212C6|nr:MULTISPECIES: hypothetical protein [unclassified Lentimonas]CAA6693512.1 Unannotated [Lentimonas sp. CC19]CAA6695844.1 Unannotated [Lentimonas sp. CC10]CAA7069764.1 Unannotated [Lentimonas sp. CC11]